MFLYYVVVCYMYLNSTGCHFDREYVQRLFLISFITTKGNALVQDFQQKLVFHSNLDVLNPILTTFYGTYAK